LEAESNKLVRLFTFVSFVCLLAVCLQAASKPVTDDVIYDQVRVKLAGDREVGAAGIDVKVQDGAVELRGNVKRDAVKAKAEKIAKRVKGVRSVTNNLQVSPLGGPPPGTNQ